MYMYYANFGFDNVDLLVHNYSYKTDNSALTGR